MKVISLHERSGSKNAVVRFSEVINEGLQANNLQVSDIDMLIPHQANLRITVYPKEIQFDDHDQTYQKYGILLQLLFQLH
jgi:3-oxoacyl-[acyl-carrier-protein] synthase-3